MKPREMNMKTRRALWPAAVGLIIAGCVALHLSDGTSPVQPSDGRASRAPTLDPGVVASAALHARTAIPVARELQLPGHATIARSGSYEEMVSSLTAEERATVEALYRAWGAGWEGAGVPNHILVFHDEAQLEWLVRNGFPTPEELLAALKMSDNELLELANTGNFKAEALYLTRKALQPPDDETPVDQTRRLAREMDMESRLVGSGTAFSAYVVALRADRAGRAHEALAAYQLARMFGDVRATEYAVQYEGFHSGTSPSATLSAFRNLLDRMGRANPAMRDMRNITAREKYPRF